MLLDFYGNSMSSAARHIRGPSPTGGVVDGAHTLHRAAARSACPHWLGRGGSGCLVFSGGWCSCPSSGHRFHLPLSGGKRSHSLWDLSMALLSGTPSVRGPLILDLPSLLHPPVEVPSLHFPLGRGWGSLWRVHQLTLVPCPSILHYPYSAFFGSHLSPFQIFFPSQIHCKMSSNLTENSFYWKLLH